MMSWKEPKYDIVVNKGSLWGFRLDNTVHKQCIICKKRVLGECHGFYDFNDRADLRFICSKCGNKILLINKISGLKEFTFN